MKNKKKNRSECFFGLHFDFHAMEGDEVGSIIDISSIERMLDETQPDMIQVDTKGHPGISSYATRAGRHADVMHMDVLKTWRALTNARGIRLYAHHSGIYDQTQARLHPDWAAVLPDGTVSTDFLSVFGPYADQVLIPQLLEIAGEYQCDGAWVDGECWASYVDYSIHAKNAWEKEKKVSPPLPEDARYPEYEEFCREGFRRYVAHYIQAVKAQYPDFEITSNWMYSYFMPEKTTVAVDYLSGDYSCQDSVRMARSIGRCFSTQHLPWDLMAWGQHALPASWKTRNRCTKEGPQLCQEAAVVLALGGGFQFFNILYGTGGLVQSWAIDSWKETALFCRAREKFCFGGKSIADIAIVFPRHYCSRHAGYKVFESSAWNAVQGWVNALADAGFCCDVVFEENLCSARPYRVLIAPAVEIYADETLAFLSGFVRQGGMVVTEPGGPLAVDFTEPEKRLLFLDGGGRLTCVEASYFAPADTSGQPLLNCYEQNYYYEPEKRTAGVLNTLGKGKIISLCFPLGSTYLQNISFAFKEFIRLLMEKGGYKAPVSVTGSDYADLTLMEKDGRRMIHLLNMAGDHNARGMRTFRDIPSIGPLTVHIRSDRPLKSAVWQPEGLPLPLNKTEDGYTVTVEKLHIHGILEIE